MYVMRRSVRAPLERADNVGGFKIRTLEKSYNTLSHTFHLGSKGNFSSKFGVYQDPVSEW